MLRGISVSTAWKRKNLGETFQNLERINSFYNGYIYCLKNNLLSQQKVTDCSENLLCLKMA